MITTMNDFLHTNITAQLLFIAVLAVIGSKLFNKFHLPAPGVMGPMITVGAFQVLGGGFHELPMNLVNSFQIIIGLFIGSKINHNKLADIRKMALPVFLIIIWTLFSTVIMTFLIHLITADLATALFSAAPGGISEMTVLALSFNSEVAIVSTFQFVRVVVIVSLIPILAKYMGREHPQPINLVSEIVRSETKTNIPRNNDMQKDKEGYSNKTLAIIGAGISGGVIFLVMNMPAGGIVGAALVLSFLNVFLQEEYVFPSKIFKLALLGIGASVGLEFSPQMIQKISEMIIPIILFSLVIVFSNLLIGIVIKRLTHWDLITCLLSSAPGGLTQMAVVGEELGGDTVKIGILQLVRVLTIISIIPFIATIIS